MRRAGFNVLMTSILCGWSFTTCATYLLVTEITCNSLQKWYYIYFCVLYILLLHCIVTLLHIYYNSVVSCIKPIQKDLKAGVNIIVSFNSNICLYCPKAGLNLKTLSLLSKMYINFSCKQQKIVTWTLSKGHWLELAWIDLKCIVRWLN